MKTVKHTFKIHHFYWAPCVTSLSFSVFLTCSFSSSFHSPSTSCPSTFLLTLIGGPSCVFYRENWAINPVSHNHLPLCPHLHLCPFCSPPILVKCVSLLPNRFPSLCSQSFHFPRALHPFFVLLPFHVFNFVPFGDLFPIYP